MKQLFTKTMAVWLIAAVLLSAAGSAVLLFSLSLQSRSALSPQATAREWQAGSDYRMSMISAFFDTDAKVTVQDIYSFRESIGRKLDEASITNELPDTRLYIDCWAAHGTVYAETTRGSVELEAFGVGGDFFYFHQLPIVDGWYFNDDESGENSVVIDETAAWQLFGGSYVSGMTLTINSIPYTVSGVVGAEEGSGYDQAYGTSPHIYMSYGMYSRINGYDGAGADIISYELVMPSPVTNFAYSFVSDTFGRKPPQAAYVENTGRYSAMKLYGRLSEFFSRSLKTDRVTYPYWENTAAVTADICAVLLLLQTIFFASAIIIAVVIAIIIIVRLVPRAVKIKDKAVDRIEEMSFRPAGPKP